VPGVDSASSNEYQDTLGPVRNTDNLPPSSADVTESGSLNLPEPSGPHRPVMGILYVLPFAIMEIMASDVMVSLTPF
jgi:hypothetical protein